MTGIALGLDEITKIALGNTEVLKVSLGSVDVWPTPGQGVIDLLTTWNVQGSARQSGVGFFGASLFPQRAISVNTGAGCTLVSNNAIGSWAPPPPPSGMFVRWSIVNNGLIPGGAFIGNGNSGPVLQNTWVQMIDPVGGGDGDFAFIMTSGTQTNALQTVTAFLEISTSANGGNIVFRANVTLQMTRTQV